MIVLFYDAITLSRYIFIFWLKNPTAVEDSFWSLFINIWIVTGCTIFAAVHSLMPGRQFIYFYTCCGIEPSEYTGLPDKPDGIIFIPSIAFQLILNAKIVLRKYFIMNKVSFLNFKKI